MRFNRRTFLSALGLLPVFGHSQAAASPRPWLTSGNRGEGHALFALNRTGTLDYAVPLPSRAHGIVFRPDGRLAVAVARRPGSWLLACDPLTGQIQARAEAGPGRHFYGHAAFSTDGATLFVTANDLRAGRGLVLVYDATAGLRKQAEWDSGGVGPHELLCCGHELAVCNGGILTRPETGRTPLNLATMRPNLTLLDSRDGAVRRCMELPKAWRLASIRHLTRMAGGEWVAGLQFQGNSRGRAPLLAICRDGRTLEPLWTSDETQLRLKDYIGSVRADADGAWFAATSPRGNRVMIGNRTGHVLAVHPLRDACGVAALDAPGAWLVSNGVGEVHRLSLERKLEPFASYAGDIRWDNHISS